MLVLIPDYRQISFSWIFDVTFQKGLVWIAECYFPIHWQPIILGSGRSRQSTTNKNSLILQPFTGFLKMVWRDISDTEWNLYVLLSILKYFFCLVQEII